MLHLPDSFGVLVIDNSREAAVSRILVYGHPPPPPPHPPPFTHILTYTNWDTRARARTHTHTHTHSHTHTYTQLTGSGSLQGSPEQAQHSSPGAPYTASSRVSPAQPTPHRSHTSGRHSSLHTFGFNSFLNERIPTYSNTILG